MVKLKRDLLQKTSMLTKPRKLSMGYYKGEQTACGCPWQAGVHIRLAMQGNSINVTENMHQIKAL